MILENQLPATQTAAFSLRQTENHSTHLPAAANKIEPASNPVQKLMLFSSS